MPHLRPSAFEPALALPAPLPTGAAKDEPLPSALVYPAAAPEWRAEWVWSRERGGPGLTVRYFRCVLAEPPPGSPGRIHVSADARYRLWLNGRAIGFGPAKGSLGRYHFDTYDLGPLLLPGRNVLAAEVRWYGENSPASEVHSPIPGWLVQGDAEETWDTPGQWRTWVSRAVTPDTTPYIDNAQEFLNHLDRVDLRREPSDWREPGFDDQAWEPVVATGNSRDTGATWGVAPMRRLTPRDLPALHESWQRFTRCIEDRAQVEHRFGGSPRGWTVPAGQGGRILLDAGHFVTGFPELRLEGGAERELRVMYAEALGRWEDGPNGRTWRKRGVRDDVQQQDPHGYRDTITLRGGETRWEPFYWRAFRWIEIEVLPGQAPLTVQDVRYRLCVHPQRFLARVAASDAQAAEIFDVSVRTLRMGAHEIYDDSPYFEQFSYIADSRMEGLASLYLCNDPGLPRRTLQLYLDTLRPDGLVDARVPCQYARQTIPYFCLHWIFMVGDYWSWMGPAEREFLRRCLVAVDTILVFFRERLRPDGFVGPTGGWNMVDQVAEWAGGQPPAVVAGGSTYLTCLFIEAMDVAVQLHEEAGHPGDGERWRVLADRLREDVRSTAWEPEEGLFVEGVAHRSDRFSQHTQAAAINAGVATVEQAQRVLQRICTDDRLIRAHSMQSFYVSRALERAGGYALWHRHVLQAWREALAKGLTTWPEYPDPSRSDSHAWAAWPAVDYVRTVLGIRPGRPGWSRVALTPSTDGLEWAKGSAPTPRGTIEVRWRKDGGQLHYQAQVPAGVPVDVTLPGCPTREFPAGGRIDLAVTLPLERSS